jgi:(p)ppGpp synthase/HD superfamily hydrolase
MAYHFITLFEGVAIEVQIKTKRMKLLNQASHFAYKEETLDAKKLLYYSQVMDRADKGDREAIQEANDILRDRDKLAYDFFINKAEYNPKKHIFED